jgi:hypothetical protein
MEEIATSLSTKRHVVNVGSRVKYRFVLQGRNQYSVVIVSTRCETQVIVEEESHSTIVRPSEISMIVMHRDKIPDKSFLAQQTLVLPTSQHQ